MEVQKMAEALKDLIIHELKEEFRESRAEVRGQLQGFQLAIESMSKRMDGMDTRLGNLESDMRALNLKQDDTNNRIESLRADLTARIDDTNNRIDSRIDSLRAELTARMDTLSMRIDTLSIRLEEYTRELGNVKTEIIALKTRHEVIDDTVRRIGKLEGAVFA
ncbi:MAG: hypothetical protein H0M93_01845 [Methanophagales archaeon]|nr:hypothetical protein [Methanophagales archaeon]